MKRFSLMTHTCSLILVIISAFFLFACSGSDGSNVPKYTGAGAQATINTTNAKDIVTKAVGVGFLPETTGDATKAVTILSRKLATPDSAFSKSASKTADSGMDYYEDILEGNFLPNIIFTPVDDADFPNISGDGSYTRTVTTTDDRTFTVTSVFTEAVHCTGVDASDRTIYTLNGTVTESYTFDYAEGAFLWTDESDSVKFDILKLTDTLSDFSRTCDAFEQSRSGYWDADTSVDPVADLFGTGFDGYAYYDNVRKNTYTLDGTFQRQVSQTETTEEASETEGILFEGSIKITETYVDNDAQVDNSFTITLTDGILDLSSSERDTVTEADGVTTTATPGDAYSLTLRGNIFYEFSEEDEYEKSSGSITMGNTRTNILTLNQTYQTEAIDYPDDHDPVYEKQTTETRDLTVTGDADVTLTTVDKTVDPEESETITLKLDSGSLTVNRAETSSYTQIIPEGDVNPVTDKSYREENLTASLTGDAITLGYLGDTYALTGALNVTLSYVRNRDAYGEPYTEYYTNLLVDMDNLRLSSNILNMALHGRVEYTIDNLENETTLGMDFVFQNNGKTYKYEGYTLTMENQDRKIALSTSYMDIQGRFYHPDYGYIDLSTNRTPFLINDDFIPISGTLTFTGADNSSASMTSFSTDSSGYMYAISVNGSEIATGIWPDIIELLNGLPFVSIAVDVE